MKQEHLILAAACAVALGVRADALMNAADVRLRGPLGQRLDAMIERHVTGADVGYITECFREKTERSNGWQTEFWGKYMHAAVPYAAYTGSERLQRNIDCGVERILASQESDGYIGNYPADLRMGEGWDVWGVKYTMMGLIHFVDGEKRKVKSEKLSERGRQALEVCKRLCDHVIAEIGPNGKRGRELWQTGNWSGYASSSILEPVVWLYRRTHERKYLDFATFIVKGMTEPEKGPRLLDKALDGVSVADRNDADYHSDGSWSYVCKHGRSKAYEMMSCYQGILDFVEEVQKVKGKGQGQGQEWTDSLRKAAIMTGEDIAKEEVNLAGGCASSEAWFHGARKQHLPYVRLQETCVTVTWMRFCEKLLEVTGEANWADEIERTFYNAYLGALKPDGSVFAAYTPLSGNRWRGMNHCFMHTDCCTANGPRGFLCFLHGLCRRTADATTFDFYATASVPGFDMYSLYPRDGFVRIVSHVTGPRTVRLRKPGWCGQMKVKVNGKVVQGTTERGYLAIARDWKLGDVIGISFDMPVVAHVLDHHVAFTRGPVLLARDSRFGDGDLSEPFRKGIAEGQCMDVFREVRTPSEDMWMAFAAVLPIGSHTENPEAGKPTAALFCDYASAGNAWRQDNFYRTWFPVERRTEE